jgi:uroporphyrinogen-III synthase
MADKQLPKKLGILQNRIQILSTRPIDPSQIKIAKDLGIDIDCLSFIETSLINDKELTKKIKELLLSESTVVFTSMNAVDAVASHLTKAKPDWKVYCIGITTNKLVKHYFGEGVIIGTATNAAELAGLIVEDRKANKLCFFCGDQRREELPSILRNNGIRVHEIEVYQTKDVTHTLNKEYQGILFFSPSAASSFFKSNQLPDSTVLFSIGTTTADELAAKSKNKIVVSDLPGKDQLVNKMISYFLESK